MTSMGRRLFQNDMYAGILSPTNSGTALDTDHSSKPDECEFVLRQAKAQLYNFIVSLGDIRNQPLDMMQFELDFPGPSAQQWVDLAYLEALVESTIRKMKSNKKIKTNWSRQDLIILLWVVEKYNKFNNKTCENYNPEDWATVGSLIPGKNGEQAMFKWLSLKSNRYTQKRQWEPWEDTCLSRLVRENQQKRWFEISKELYLQKDNTTHKYRTAKQCRQRWACYLNPTIKKGHWTHDEDFILFSSYLDIGKKWSVITKQLEGRTENAVKNRWKLVMDKYEKTYKKSEMTVREFFQEYLGGLRGELEAEKVKMLEVEEMMVLPDFPALEKLQIVTSPRLTPFPEIVKQHGQNQHCPRSSLAQHSLPPFQYLHDDLELQLHPGSPTPKWPPPSKQQTTNYLTYEIDHDQVSFGYFLNTDKLRKSSFFE